jgi:hypothetical protein
MKWRQSPLQSFFLKSEAFISAKGFHAQILSIGSHFKKSWLVDGDVGAKGNKNRHQAWHGVKKGVNPAPRIETQGFL